MSNTTMQMMALHLKDARGEMMDGPAPSSMPGSMHGMNMAVMQECIEACSASEQACTMCAGSMMNMPESAEINNDSLAMAMAMCMNTADMCNTMMRMMMRPNGMDQPTMMAMLNAMMMMSMACADACDSQSAMKPQQNSSQTEMPEMGMSEMGMSGVETSDMGMTASLSEMALCAEVCRQCAMACQKMMDSMVTG